MRKPIPLFVTLILGVAILGGCAKEDPAPPAPDTFQPNFSSVESEKMGAYMTRGKNLITEESTYVSFRDRLNVQHKVIQVEDGVIDGTDVETTPERSIFDVEELANCSFLSEGPDEAVYLLTSDQEIARLPNGRGEYDVVAGPGISTLQVVENKLYYSKGDDSHFFSSDLDGGKEAVVLDKEIYYPYVIDNFIIYQDELDNQSLHLYNMKEKRDVKLLDGYVHTPNVVGNWIFCIQKDPETTYGQLVGIEFMPSGEFNVHVYNRDDEDWFANMYSLRYITREAHSSIAGEFIYSGKLMFAGAPVGNFGTDSEEVFTNLEGPMGISVAELMFNSEWRVGGDRNNLYTSPYGYIYIEQLDDTFYLRFNERAIVMPDGLFEAEWSEKMIEAMKQ